MLSKIVALYSALRGLYAKFPDVKADAESLIEVIEGIVIQHAWNLSSLSTAISAAQKLVVDFEAEWGGGQAELSAFADALKALFKA